MFYVVPYLPPLSAGKKKKEDNTWQGFADE